MGRPQAAEPGHYRPRKYAAGVAEPLLAAGGAGPRRPSVPGPAGAGPGPGSALVSNCRDTKRARNLLCRSAAL